MNLSHRSQATEGARALELERELRNLEVDLYNDFELYGEAGIRQVREILQLDSRLHGTVVQAGAARTRMP